MKNVPTQPHPGDPVTATKILTWLLASAKMTRFVTSDWLFEWWLLKRLRDDALAEEAELRNAMASRGEGDDYDPHYPLGQWRMKLVKGLECPHCVGYWITALMLLVMLFPLPRPLAWCRDKVMVSLAGSYVVGHVSAKLD